MAIRTFLGSGDTFTAANNNIQVFGATGTGTEKLLIQSGVTGITTNSDIERVELAGNLADYKFVFTAGTGIVIQNTAGTAIGTIPSLNQNATIAFADGSTPLIQTGGTTATLGGQTLSTTTATAYTTATLGANFSTTDKSTVVTTTTPTTPTIGFSAATASVTEGDTNSTVTLTVSLSAAQATATTVNYTTTGGSALAGSDFTATTSSVSIPANSTSATFTIPIVGDIAFENSETFTVTLNGQPSGFSLGTSTATVTITDNDSNATPTNSITGTLTGVTGGGSSELKGITVGDTNDATGTVTFTAGNGILTFDANASQTGFSYDPASRSGSTVKVTGNLTAINSAIAAGELTYVTNLTTAGSDSLSVSVTDPHATSSTAATGVINVGMPLILTAGTNNTLTGGTGSDTITGDATTVEAGDSVDGGNGTDLLHFKTAATNALVNATVNSVENVIVQTDSTTTTTPTLDASKLSATGVNIKFVPGDNTDAFTVTELSTNYTVQVDNSSLTTPGTGTISVGGAAAIQVAMDGGDKITTLTTTSTATGLTVTSTGSTNTISTLTAGTLSTLVTVKGTGNLTVGALGHATNITQIAAESTYSGNLSFTGSAGTGAMTITGGLGNDTLIGGTAADKITGGKGVDSMTGGTGADTFMFTQGDTSSTSRDVITDLALGDIINLSGYTGISLTSGGTLATNAGAKAANSTLDVYIDSTNSRLVIETADTGSTVTTEEITIGDAAKASFTIGASNTLIVGNQPLTSTNNGAGTLTIEGAAIGAGANVILIAAPTAPTVNAITIGGNSVSIINASKVVPGGSGNTTDGINISANAFASAITVTGSDYNDTLLGGAASDTLTPGKGADVVTGGDGGDTISLTETTAAVDRVVFTTVDDGATANTNTAGTFDVITGFVFTAGAGGDEIVFGGGAAGLNLAFDDVTANDTMAGTAGIAGASAFGTNELFVLTTSVGAGNLTTLATVATAIGAVTVGTTVAANAVNDGIVIVNDGTNSAIYLYINGDTNDAVTSIVVEADELTLLGTVNGVINTFDALDYLFV